MRTYSPLFLLAALGVLSAAGTAAAADTSEWKCESCPFPKGASGSVDVGLGAVSDASSKFGDFTGLQRDGAHLVLGGALRYRSDSGYFADLTASELGLDARSLAALTGREGIYSLRVAYSEVPRHLSSSAASPFLGIGTGSLALPAGYPADTTGAMPLAGTLQPVALGYQQSRLELGGSWIASPRWTYRVNLRHDVRDGSQRVAGSFFSSAAQLAAPVDHVTDQLELSVAYADPRLQATLAYHVSQFRNGTESLTWANPFTPIFAGSGSGQLALAPDNQFHQISGSAGYAITPQIRASADFAVGRMTQDAAFLAPTLNPNLALTLASLPAASLDGRVDTFSGSVKLTATPRDGLRINASYARDLRDNRSAILAYPVVDTDMFWTPSVTRSNTPFTITQDRFKLNADYRGPATLKVSGGIDYDQRERSYQEVLTTRETTLWARASAQARENLSLSVKLAHAERDHSAYGTSVWFGLPQNPLLRKYNLADRKRDSAALRADLAINDKLALGVNLDLANDDYDRSAIGLTAARSVNLGADLSYAVSDKTQLHLFAQGERIRSEQAGSQAFAAPDWSARNKDRFEIVGLGVKHVAIADKLDLGADLAFSRSTSNITVDTGATVPAFPSATTRLDSVKLHATYKLSDKVSLTGSVWHERYDAQDWRLDGVLPATVSDLLTLGDQPPRYTVNVLRLALRYRF